MKSWFWACAVRGAVALSLIGVGQPQLALAEATTAAKATRDVFQTLPYATLGIGTQSGCAHPAKMALTDEAQWRRVWNTHTRGLTNPPKLPAVDFAHQIVLILLSGTAPHGTSIEVAQVVQGPQATLVYYFVNQDPELSTQRSTLTTQAFHFAVLDKPATPIRFADAVGRTCSDCGK